LVDKEVIVIGAGLAGSEAAWQVANSGIPVKLVEMRPIKSTPAHHTGEFGELVCSNSFGALSPDRAAGLLQKELRTFKSLIVQTADKFAVPAGGALAVDRSKFSNALTEVLSNHPLIEIKRFEQLDLPSEEHITILATGPLTADNLSYKIQDFTGIDDCHFFDAASPIINGDSIDQEIVFKASRYDKGDRAYLNCPMNKNDYIHFRNALIEGEQASLKDFEKESANFFEACLPIEEIANLSSGPKIFQLYIHKDQSITNDLIDRCKRANFNGMCITVDTIVAGNRERDHRTGFTTPPKFTLDSLMSFAMRPQWVFNYFTNKKFELANLKDKVEKGTNIAQSVMGYINEQYDPAMNWKDAEYCVKKWNGPFALKGVMSVEDAKRAIDIGCTAIMISNHGGRQLDGSRSPFDQVKAISDAVGDKLEIILDGGIRRGTHVLKALAAGAKACSFGKMFLFSLAAGGQDGVEKLLENILS